MKAVRLSRFGGPDSLALEDLPQSPPAAGEALIRIEAASINPSDVKNTLGAMSQTTLPRTPGRDYAGIVVAGPADWIGAEIWGSGNGGFLRDGSHAETLLVPVASLRRKPAALSFAQAASVGVNFLAAWRGLVDAAGLQAGETVAIIGAGGGVGGAAAQIARRIGARIIGIDRNPPPPDAAINAIADHRIIGSSDLPADLRAATGGKGAAVVLDCVGGVMFDPAVKCLAPAGRLVEMSVTGQRVVSFDLADFYHNESRLFGIDTLSMDLTEAAAVLEQLAPGFESGDYRPAPIARTHPLAEAAAAYRSVAAGERGRIVLLPRE